MDFNADLMVDFGAELYTLFQNNAFISGVVRCDKSIESISFIAHDRIIPLSFEVETGRLFDRIPFSNDERPFFHTPVLRMFFSDGTTVTSSDFLHKRLGGESFWRTAHIALNEMRNRGSGSILEIGSRARSGISRREQFTPPGWEYVGFDVMAGTNVDVVGDAHDISGHFPAGAFDAVIAMSVLEHLMMPWKFIVELNRILKLGAIGLFVTHQAYPIHDQPWDFWRFSDTSWTALLNSKTGFEIIEARMAEPAFLVPQFHHAAVDHNQYMSYQSSSVAFRKISECTLNWDVKIAEITDTSYPSGEVGAVAV